MDIKALLPWLSNSRAGKTAGKTKDRKAAENICGSAIKLNVGGNRFDLPAAAVASLPEGSPLLSLSKYVRDAGGCHFVDRDGRHFQHIIDFLTGGADACKFPEAPDQRRELYREACFYKVTGLVLLLQDAYPGAPKPINEAERLMRVESLGVMRTDAEQRFDRITSTLASILNMPIALLTLVGKDQVWFKSRSGLDAPEVPRNTAWCAYTLVPEYQKKASMLVINDTTKDPRAKENPLVVSEANIRFYSGCPLVTSDGHRLGTLCVLDRVPRQLKKWQMQLHANLAQIAAQEIQRAELTASVDDTPTTARTIESGSMTLPTVKDYASGPVREGRMREALDEMVCLVRVDCDSRDWPILYANERWIGTIKTDVNSKDDDHKLTNFWDIFDPSERSVDSQLREIQQAWGARRQPHVFALEATMRQPSEASQRFTCKFVPADQPLDMAAAAVALPEDSVAPQASKYPSIYQSHYYFVLMVPCEPEEDAVFSI